ncbi:MAG: hypothetical protein QXU32_12935 [Nitrososphaerales archaeon]
MKRYALILTAMIGIVILAGTALQPALAFPHALKVKDITVHGMSKKILIVIGHTNEPTFGAKTGIHDGKHHVEVFLEDEATGLPLANANLKVDKYYFKDLSAFNKATSVNQATEVQTNISLRPVFGDPGHYMARQIQKDGIYGYRLYGTISYFGEAQVTINETIFCRLGAEGGSGGGDTSKFNTAGWFGGYGCTDDITKISFPQKNPAVKAVSDAIDTDSNIHKLSYERTSLTSGTLASSGDRIWSEFSPQLLTMSISGAAIAGLFGIRRLREHKE